MPQPTQRKTQIRLNLNDLKKYLQASRLALGEMPETFWFDIRNDEDKAFVAGRVKLNGREYSFRIPGAEISGDSTNWTFPVAFMDLFSLDCSGEVTLKFQLPAVLLQKNGNKKKHAVGIEPHEAVFHPFPSNGEYRFEPEHTVRAKRILDLRKALGVNAHFHLRYQKSLLELYVSNGTTMLRAGFDMEAEPGLWDVEIPMLVSKYLANSPGIVIDHMHGFGTWFSDGRSFYFAQKSSMEIHDYTFDVPGAARVVRKFGRTFPLSSELFEVVLSQEGPYLIKLYPGQAQVHRLNPEKVNYHENLEVYEAVVVPLDFRGEPSALILDSRTIKASLIDANSLVYVTSFPCSPYVIQESSGVEIMVVPPEVNPRSLADALGDDFRACGDVLRDWSGDYDGLVPMAFKDAVEPTSTMFPNVPRTDEMDTLFLVRIPEGFLRVGGVSADHLATCLFEFYHSQIYQQDLLERFIYGDYWPGLQVFVYDPDHAIEYGVDETSPWPEWLGWEFWSDPKGERPRDGAGRPVEKPEKGKRKVQLSSNSLVAPQIITAEDGLEDPISVQERVSVEDPVVSTEEAPTNYLLIDGNFVTWRDFYSKGLEKMRHPVSGRFTGVVFGFLRSMKSWVHQFAPKHICVVWDDGISVWRKELIPEYKDRSDRKKKLPKDRLDSMFEQRAWLHENLSTMGVHSIRIPGSEADDVIALLADSHAHAGRVVIVTGDYDFNHLVTERIHVYQARKNELVDDPATAQDSLMEKVIVGDSSDRIPGVEKVGEKSVKTFAEELRKAGKPFTLENIQEAAAEHKNWRIRRLAEDDAKGVIERNLQMIDLRVGMAKLDPTQMTSAISQSLQQVCLDPLEFGKWMHELAFNSIISEASVWHNFFRPLT
jgi:5'-3' exonuclease